MTKQKTLENFLKSVIKDSVKILNEINSKEQLKLLQELQYEFKQDYFNKTTTVKKNDFGEFFSRKGLIQSLEKINDFDDVVDMISGYSNSKAYLARGIDAKNLIHLFIENYIIYANDFKFIESKFNDIFKSFLKFLDSEILKVRYFTPIFRLSFPSKYRQKELGEIRLTKINEEQFKIIKESLVGKGTTPGFLHKLGYVLETTIGFENNPEKEDKKADVKFKKFLNMVHLFDGGDVKIGALYKNFTPWMTNSSKILNLNEIQLGPKNFKLNLNSYKKLKTFYNEFCKSNLENKDWSFIQVAIDRFSSSIFRNNDVDKIVDLNVALECLFSSAGETSLKISNRSAMMVGFDENDRESCWNFIKDTYKLRNAILHGRKGTDFDITNDILELEKIIRVSIRKFLNISKNISKKELKLKGKIEKDDTIRDYILKELDLGLINRTRLDAFSIQSSGPFD
jgi:hypothetical protein